MEIKWLINKGGSLFRFQQSAWEKIAAQNNAIRTNYIKGKIDNTQQVTQQVFWLCAVRDETINHIMIECSKLPQITQSRPDNQT